MTTKLEYNYVYTSAENVWVYQNCTREFVAWFSKSRYRLKETKQTEIKVIESAIYF